MIGNNVSVKNGKVEKITIFIIDEQKSFRTHVLQILSKQPDFRVLAHDLSENPIDTDGIGEHKGYTDCRNNKHHFKGFL